MNREFGLRGGRPFRPPVNILITVLHEYMHGNGAADLTPVLAERSAPRTFTMYIFPYISDLRNVRHATRASCTRAWRPPAAPARSRRRGRIQTRSARHNTWPHAEPVGITLAVGYRARQDVAPLMIPPLSRFLCDSAATSLGSHSAPAGRDAPNCVR